MSNSRERIAMALAPSQVPTPYNVNPVLEQRAVPDSPPIHPLVRAIMDHMGLLGAVRNRRNEALGDLEQVAQ